MAVAPARPSRAAVASLAGDRMFASSPGITPSVLLAIEPNDFKAIDAMPSVPPIAIRLPPSAIEAAADPASARTSSGCSLTKDVIAPAAVVAMPMRFLRAGDIVSPTAIATPSAADLSIRNEPPSVSSIIRAVRSAVPAEFSSLVIRLSKLAAELANDEAATIARSPKISLKTLSRSAVGRFFVA